MYENVSGGAQEIDDSHLMHFAYMYVNAWIIILLTMNKLVH